MTHLEMRRTSKGGDREPGDACQNGVQNGVSGEIAVTKNDMVIEIAKETGLRQVDIKRIVQRTLDWIIEVLITEQRIELRNFGVFEVKERKPRKARNPRTGEEVDVPAKRVVTFKPGKLMEEKIAMMIGQIGEAGQPSSDAAPPPQTDPEHGTTDQAATP